MLEQDLTRLSIKALTGAIRSKEISPVEVVDFYLDRIEKYNPKLNAIVYLDRENARRLAKEAEDKVMRGEALGSLHGIPTAAKDIGPSVPGWPDTYGGIRALKELHLDTYSHFTRSMIAAGAIPVGKTNSPSFAFRGVTDNFLFGPTQNPFCPGYNPGGSSGGTSAALAAGLLPIAEGTDAGGSIRIPASWSGIFGFKSSFGTIPLVMRPNAFGAVMPFCVGGPMARSVEDTIEGLKVVAGYSNRDPYSIDRKFDYDAALKNTVKGWRIGYTDDYGIFPVQEDIRAAVRRAAGRFEELGAVVEPVEFDFKLSCLEMGDLWCRIVTTTALTNLARLKEMGIDLLGDHSEDLPPEMLYWLDLVSAMTVPDQLRDLRLRSTVYDEVENKMEKYDLILSPTLACHPVKNLVGETAKGPASINGVPCNQIIGWCLTIMTSLTGHASASVPVCVTEEGFPIGMHIMGQRYGDLAVLTAAAEFERISPWRDTYDRIRL